MFVCLLAFSALSYLRFASCRQKASHQKLNTADTKVGYKRRGLGAKTMCFFCTAVQDKTTRTAMHVYFSYKNHEVNKLY